MLPLSLAKAMTEPEKVIAPIAAPSAISILLTGSIMKRANSGDRQLMGTRIPNAPSLL